MAVPVASSHRFCASGTSDNTRKPATDGDNLMSSPGTSVTRRAVNGPPGTVM